MGEKITDDRGGDLQRVGFYGGVEGDGERAGTRGEVFAPESDYRGAVSYAHLDVYKRQEEDGGRNESARQVLSYAFAESG